MFNYREYEVDNALSNELHMKCVRFWIKFKFNQITSVTKFLCVKTSSLKVVVEPFHYLTVAYIDVGGKRNPST